jgi:hypothetical protein
MKLYLAARYSRRTELKKHAARLKKLGYKITSRWLSGHDHPWVNKKSKVWENFAVIDLEDVDAADAVVSFTHPRGTPVTGGGRHVEFGYGYSKGKRMILIGERENVFHHLPGIEIYPDLDTWLAREKKNKWRKEPVNPRPARVGRRFSPQRPSKLPSTINGARSRNRTHVSKIQTSRSPLSYSGKSWSDHSESN